MKTSRRSFSRRAVGAALGAATFNTAINTALSAPPTAAGENKPPDDWRGALQRLLEGNKRFANEESRHPHNAKDWRKRLTDGQKPFATIVGCSDSRVPPELLFDQGFGDLFVIRIAGNVIDTDVVGSVEYGVDHLGTRVVVVMGHDGCGAVTAALSAEADLAKEPNEIRSLVGKISPAIAQVDQQQPFDIKLKRSVEANVRLAVRQLKDVPDLRNAVKDEQTHIVGCVYDINSGLVRVLKS